ncbi:DNA-directed RNA polymerase subunit A' [Marine Group I thaumarchaeote]|uniref:Multifunctional fusion protein n=1 Tax=Marine Group I thaumarchaeote TaxID=2511932 RepID=A0A7K4NTP6_9ARCH|nr:DNA-directed RNA polymerase subunit A' [Marine Group I thaumarchaeote]
MSIQTVKTIAGIKFCVWSPNEVRKYSVAEITAPETYDEDGMAVQGGLMDGRLGTLEPGQKCLTCGNTSARCPGHFGHIELAEPILHIAFIDNIHKLLVATCRSCSRLKVPQEALDVFLKIKTNRASYTVVSQKRIPEQILEKAKKAKECPHCGKSQYELIFTKPTIFIEKTDLGENRLLPVTIRERFSQIIDADLDLLNYNIATARPEWFILQAMPVPPVTVRPSIILETGIRSEDDLTHKMVDIIRVNQRLKESKEAGTPPLIVQDLVDLLQYHTTTYFDNEVSGIPQAHHRSGRPLKTLTQRLKGKEGRFRGSLSGKRVDFSSRTVISPDPNLDLGEVGVPEAVATKLTIPEIVTEWNIEKLKKLVINGPSTWPGVNYIVRPDGVKIRLDFVEDRSIIADSLEIGYLVERHLNHGDVVLFNRQPSLHQMSIMAHHVRVLPGKTFRLHPSVCPPYNADFDGDEMNLHIPQSEEARAEAILLMRVQEQLISPRFGGPIIGALRDFITGAYLLTKDDTTLTKQEFANLAMLGGYDGKLPEPKVNNKNGSLYTGKQLFSIFLPSDFNLILTSKWSKGTNGTSKDIVIKNGELISGVIDKSSIGAEEPESVLHRIAKDYGNEKAKKFLNSVLIIIKQFITDYGFSYGYSDLELSEKDRGAILTDLKETYDKVSDITAQKNKGTLTSIRGMTIAETAEALITYELGKARDRAGITANSNLADDNAGKIMATTGARGSALNVGQMAGALGQQSRRGKRLHTGYDNRTLAHFAEYDENPDSHGFVKSNFRDGLSVLEFFFHAMGGREGLVDTAVRTQQSGYMQRRLINALEHIRLEYDGTVRDPHGHIIQFLYGEDGIDVAKSDHGEAFNINRLVESESIIDTGSKATKDEINTISKKYTKTFNTRLTSMVTDALRASKLSKAGLENVCKKGLELYDKSQVEPGQAVGIVTAQSIGEPGTQMTLRTFHTAGIAEKNVTLGLPRIIELVDARKKPSTPSMDIYLDKDSKSSKEKAIQTAKEILETAVRDLIIHPVETDYQTKIILNVDSARLKNRGCTLEDIISALESNKKFKLKHDNNKITLQLEVESDAPTVVALRNKILKTTVKGVPTIERLTLKEENGEWLIQTTGSNLAKVLSVKGVEKNNVRTNNVFEIGETLGIEAARNALINELKATLENQGLEVDMRYLMLVADLMCHKGDLQQIGRHGIAGKKNSVLARAAFEITVPTIANAAKLGEIEELKGITENVIVGSQIPIGSGTVDIFMKSNTKK